LKLYTLEPQTNSCTAFSSPSVYQRFILCCNGTSILSSLSQHRFYCAAGPSLSEVNGLYAGRNSGHVYGSKSDDATSRITFGTPEKIQQDASHCGFYVLFVTHSPTSSVVFDDVENIFQSLTARFCTSLRTSIYSSSGPMSLGCP
jgi:hypothetical protein